MCDYISAYPHSYIRDLESNFLSYQKFELSKLEVSKVRVIEASSYQKFEFWRFIGQKKKCREKVGSPGSLTFRVFEVTNYIKNFLNQSHWKMFSYTETFILTNCSESFELWQYKYSDIFLAQTVFKTAHKSFCKDCWKFKNSFKTIPLKKKSLNFQQYL